MHNGPLKTRQHRNMLLTIINSWELFSIENYHSSPTKYLKTKTTCTQQLLRVVIHTKWGADRQALLKLYRALVCSQLDYGIFIYRSARKLNLKRLNPIHHKSLRLVWSSPVISLYTGAHEAPLHLRCEKLALQYLRKTEILLIYPSLRLHLQPQIQTTVWTKRKKPSNLQPLDGTYSLRICNFCYKCS